MSKARTIVTKCPDCGKEFQFMVYDSVNVNLDPFLREKIMNGDIFTARCPKCGAEIPMLYELLYHDMTHKFMIKFDDVPGLLNYEKMVKNNDANNPFFNLMNGYKHLGSSTLPDLVTNILCLERGLDWRVIKIVIAIMEHHFHRHCEERNMPKYNIVASGLIEDKDNQLLISLHVIDDNDERDCFTIPFVKNDLYDQVFTDVIKQLDTIDPFIFDTSIAKKFFSAVYSKGFNVNATMERYVVELSSGQLVICDCPAFLKKEMKNDTLVLATMPGPKREIGHIVNKITFHPSCLLYHDDYCGDINSLYTENHMVTTHDSNATLGQDDLVKKLLLFKEKGEDELPLEELRHSNMFICSKTTLNVENDELTELVSKNELSGEVKFVTNFQKIKRDGKMYLALYTDPFYLPAEEEKYSNAVFGFDCLVRIIKNDPRYDGIIINQYDENITLDLRSIYLYIMLRIVESKEESKSFINGLTDDEKAYFDELEFEYVKAVYVNNIDKEEFFKQNNISKSNAEKPSKKANEKLGELIFAKF